MEETNDKGICKMCKKFSNQCDVCYDCAWESVYIHRICIWCLVKINDDDDCLCTRNNLHHVQKIQTFSLSDVRKLVLQQKTPTERTKKDR